MLSLEAGREKVQIRFELVHVMLRWMLPRKTAALRIQRLFIIYFGIRASTARIVKFGPPYVHGRVRHELTPRISLSTVVFFIFHHSDPYKPMHVDHVGTKSIHKNIEDSSTFHRTTRRSSHRSSLDHQKGRKFITYINTRI